MKLTRAVLFALVATVLGASTGAAEARDLEVDDQCVVHIVDQLPSGELLVSDPACYPSFAEAMQAEGVDAWGTGASARATSMAAATFTIGTHYDGFGFTGASTSVVGSNCNGGWLNTSSAWNNRISSTKHGCPRIRHYNGQNLTGSSETTFSPGGNLGPLNNATSSIQYLT
jgi:hypothetical protein